MNYLNIGEEIIMNENITGILSSVKEKNLESLEIEIYTNVENIGIIIGSQINLKIYISKYIKDNNLYLLPIKSLNLEQEKSTIKIVENNKIITKEVEYLQITNDKILVSSGLSEGDQVIIENNKLLNEGEIVEIEEY